MEEGWRSGKKAKGVVVVWRGKHRVLAVDNTAFDSENNTKHLDVSYFSLIAVDVSYFSLIAVDVSYFSLNSSLHHFSPSFFFRFFLLLFFSLP